MGSCYIAGGNWYTKIQVSGMLACEHLQLLLALEGIFSQADSNKLVFLASVSWIKKKIGREDKRIVFSQHVQAAIHLVSAMIQFYNL